MTLLWGKIDQGVSMTNVIRSFNDSLFENKQDEC